MTLPGENREPSMCMVAANFQHSSPPLWDFQVYALGAFQPEKLIPFSSLLNRKAYKQVDMSGPRV